jgi:hypothetical protein
MFFETFTPCGRLGATIRADGYADRILAAAEDIVKEVSRGMVMEACWPRAMAGTRIQKDQRISIL